MTEPTTIDMVRCCYCKDEWCRKDAELVCNNCESILAVDLAVASLVSSVDELTLAKSADLNKRIDLLLSIHHKLTKLLKTAAKKEKENENMEA